MTALYPITLHKNVQEFYNICFWLLLLHYISPQKTMIKIIKKRPMQNKENINNEMSLNIYFLIKLPPDSTLLLLKPDSWDNTTITWNLTERSAHSMPSLAHSSLFLTFGKLHDTAAKLSLFVAISSLKGREFPIFCYKLFRHPQQTSIITLI